jgi:hypothetical protein
MDQINDCRRQRNALVPGRVIVALAMRISRSVAAITTTSSRTNGRGDLSGDDGG